MLEGEGRFYSVYQLSRARRCRLLGRCRDAVCNDAIEFSAEFMKGR